MVGPRFLEAREIDWPSKVLLMSFVAKQGCGSHLFFVLWRSVKFATVIQATYHIEDLHGATRNGRNQEFLFPIGAESQFWSQIMPTSCLYLLKASVESVRVGGSSTAGREADRVDPNQVGAKATHGTNTKQGGDGTVWACGVH